MNRQRFGRKSRLLQRVESFRRPRDILKHTDGESPRSVDVNHGRVMYQNRPARVSAHVVAVPRSHTGTGAFDAHVDRVPSALADPCRHVAEEILPPQLSARSPSLSPVASRGSCAKNDRPPVAAASSANTGGRVEPIAIGYTITSRFLASSTSSAALSRCSGRFRPTAARARGALLQAESRRAQRGWRRTEASCPTRPADRSPASAARWSVDSG